MRVAWPTVRLGDVLRLDLDRVAVDAATVYPMVGVLSFGRGLFDREPIESGNTSYRYFCRLKSEHVVMSQLFGWEGALALSSPAFSGKYVSPQFPTFLCDDVRLDRRFLGFLMRRPAFWEELGTRASGMGDRRRTLNPESLFACEIPLPPLSEQRRIVGRIEGLAAEIETARRLRAEAVEEAGAVDRWGVTALLQKGHWDFLTVGDLIGCDGLRNGKSLKGDGLPSAYRCLTLSSMRGGRVDLAKSKLVPIPRKEAVPFLVQCGDVFVVRGNGSKHLCGQAGLVAQGSDSVIFPDLFIHVALPTERILPEFFVALWNGTAVRSVVEDKAKTTSGIWKINQGHIASTTIPLPPLCDQRRIVAELDALQAEVDALKSAQAETGAELDALLPSILDRAFKGEL